MSQKYQLSPLERARKRIGTEGIDNEVHRILRETQKVMQESNWETEVRGSTTILPMQVF
jgi:hypothetical protein